MKRKGKAFIVELAILRQRACCAFWLGVAIAYVGLGYRLRAAGMNKKRQPLAHR